MPIKLSTTLSKISSVPNSTNASLLDELYAFMRTTQVLQKVIATIL